MTKFAARFFVLGAMLVGSAAYAQTPTHVYDLNNSYADLLGGPSLGNDGGTLLAGGGYQFGPDQGLTLSGVFTGANASVYSIVFDATYSNLTGNRGNGYVKMVDFDNLQLDAGYYGHDGFAALYSSAQALTQAYSANQVFQTVLTRDASGTFSAYVNGVLQFSVDDATDQFGVFAGPDGIARFFEDDDATSNEENSPGTIDYIATYDVALDATQAADVTEVESPTTTTPEPASLGLLATGLVGVIGIARRRKQA